MAGWAVLTIIGVLGLTAYFVLLPGDLNNPEVLPTDMGAVDSHSRIFLFGTSGDDSSRARVQWASDSDDDVSFMASIEGPEAVSALVFAGPVSALMKNCEVNARPVQLQPGFPGSEFDSQLRSEALDSYSSANVAHLPMKTTSDAASPYVACEVSGGFSSSEPPSHLVYTPELVASVDGFVDDDPLLDSRSICVERSVADDSSDQVCANVTGRAEIGYQLQEIQRPREQSSRDLKLALLGLALGLIAQGVWELAGRAKLLQKRSKDA